MTESVRDECGDGHIRSLDGCFIVGNYVVVHRKRFIGDVVGRAIGHVHEIWAPLRRILKEQRRGGVMEDPAWPDHSQVEQESISSRKRTTRKCC